MTQLVTIFLVGLLSIGNLQQSQTDASLQQTPEQQVSEQQQSIQSDSRADSQQVIPRPEPMQKRRRVPSPRPDWGHGHEVWPGTDQQPASDDPVMSGQRDGYSSRQSGLDGVTKKINPDDINYGGLLALWRLQVVHDTLLKAEYWGVVGEGFLIIFLLLYVAWMRNQRAERFRMTVDMVHQLVNSRGFARFHAKRVIGIHNELVRKLNDEYESKIRSGSAEDEQDSLPQTGTFPKLTHETHELVATTKQAELQSASVRDDVRGSLKLAPIPLVAAEEYGADLLSSDPFESRMRSSVQIQDVLAKANAAAASSAEFPPSTVGDQEDKDAKIRRLEAQVVANAQRIRALRNNLNRQRQDEACEVGNDGQEGVE